MSSSTVYRILQSVRGVGQIYFGEGRLGVTRTTKIKTFDPVYERLPNRSAVAGYLAKQATGGSQQSAPAGGGALGGGFIIPLLLMMAMFYFVLIRPQRKQQKAQEEMRKNVRVKDKVVTIGGMHGIVTGTTDRTVSIKVADNTSIKFDRSAIATVTAAATRKDSEEEELDEESNESEEKES